MTQKTQGKNEAAEERSKDTRRFARQVRSATRRKYTAEEKIHIVLEGFRREVTVNELCRREGIKPNNFYSWTKEFMEAGKHRLSRDTTRGHSLREHCSQEGKRGPEASGGRAILGSSPSEKNVGAVSRRRRRQRMSVDEKAQVLRRLNHPQAPSARFWQSLEYPRATATVGEPDTGKAALRAVDIQVHPGIA